MSLSGAVPPPSRQPAENAVCRFVLDNFRLLMVLASWACHNITRAEKFSATDLICVFESAAETPDA
jgi:hypothetical protein